MTVRRARFDPPRLRVSVRPMATAVADDRIDLTWEDMSYAENGHAIEHCTGSGCTDFVEVARVAADAESYSNTGLAAGTTYRYRVRAFNDKGFSYYSYDPEATTSPVPPLPPPPPAPSGLTATAVTETQILVPLSTALT
jgi:hypothetical protein